MGVKGFEHKKCFFCGSKLVVKNGKRNGKQRYKCNDCGRRFDGGERLDSAFLWQLYSERKQTKEERNLSVLRLKIVSNIAYNDIVACLIFYHSFALD